MTLNMRQTIQRNQAIRVIEAGLLGSGDWVCIVNEDTLRFSKAIALGNGKFPEHNVIHEDELGTTLGGLDSEIFLIEVPTSEEPSLQYQHWLLDNALKAGYYIAAFNKARELDTDMEVRLGQLVCTHKNEVLLREDKGDFKSQDTYIEVEGILTHDGCLMFEKTITSSHQVLFDEVDEVTMVCDGYVYPYDTQVTINDDMSVSLSDTPTREMNNTEWTLAKTQPSDVKFIHQAM